MTPENLAILSFDTPSAGGCLKAEQPMFPAWAGSVQISKQIEFFHRQDIVLSRQDGIPYGGRSGILEIGLREIELALARTHTPVTLASVRP